MVTTRARNGVITKAPARTLDYATESKDDLDFDGSNDDSNEEDIIETKKRKGKGKKPTAKRQKTSGGDASGSKSKTSGTPKRRGKDLSLLMTSMPFDIFCEILRQLTPKDLLNLSRTNHALRSVMFAADIVSVWKTAREAFDGPEPPEDWTEQKWAGLLFETTCQSCGTRGITNPDWLLLRRACSRCKKAHLVYGPRTKSRFPHVGPEILDYTPYTHSSAWTRPWQASQQGSKFFWDEDVEAAMDDYTSLRWNEMDAWKREQTDKIAKRKKMVKVYELWEHQVAKMHATQAESIREERLKGFKARFMEIGYESQDIDSALTVYTDGIYTGTPNVTNAVWTRLRPALEDLVVTRKNRRINHELQPYIKDRMVLFQGLYEAFTAKIRPNERYIYPSADAHRTNPDLLKVLEADKDVVVDSSHFAAIIEKLDIYASRYHERVKTSILKKLPDDLKSIDLACNVFRREAPYYSRPIEPFRGALIGWSMIASHVWARTRTVEIRPGVGVEMPSGYELHPEASACAKTMIELCGLDPVTTTIEEMDALDRRFVCEDCVSRKGYPVYTWRRAVVHSCPPANTWRNTSHSMRLATEVEESEAKSNDARLRDNAAAWSCNHCSDFLDLSTARSKAAVLSHLQTEHPEISDPNAPQDYFVNERCRFTYERPHEILENNAQRFHCLCVTCPAYHEGDGAILSTGSSWLYSESGIRAHAAETCNRPFDQWVVGSNYEIVGMTDDGAAQDDYI